MRCELTAGLEPGADVGPGSGTSLSAALAGYRCEDCDQPFWVAPDAPQVMDGFEDLRSRPAPAEGGDPNWPTYRLGCPWCQGWAWPLLPQSRAGAGRHPDDDPSIRADVPSRLYRSAEHGEDESWEGD